MAAKSLRLLADELWGNHGVVLLASLDSGLAPGSVLERRGWNDMARVGHLTDGIPEPQLPVVSGPESCLLADFRRPHDLELDAAVTLLGAGAAAATARQGGPATATFARPVMYSIGLLDVEDALEAQPEGFWEESLGRWFKDDRMRLVHQVIRARVSFHFAAAAGAAAAGVPAGPGAAWRWRDDTLEAHEELTVAVRLAKYDAQRRRFDPAR